MSLGGPRNDDPRKLRELLGRAGALASDHSLSSVVVGLAGREGDLLIPELIDFLQSALRVDDALFRMTRERAVVVLADVDRRQALGILDRLLHDFRERFAVVHGPEVRLGYFEVTPATRDVSVKHILPIVFGPDAA